jgi:hypothetical protein
MRKDNTDVGGKIPEMSMSGKLTQGFGVGYHKCLPSADTSVGGCCPGRPLVPRSLPGYLQIRASWHGE